ncbi:MAG: glycosyltransferase [Candidatus Binatia bacterium]
MPVVAHFVPLYLPRTETFIYQIITHHRRYHPIVLAQHRVETASLFPFREVYAADDLSRRWSFHAWYQRAQHYLRGKTYVRFESLLARRRARLLHVHFGHTGAELIGLSRRLGVPQVTSFYGWDDTVPLADETRRRSFERLFREGAAFLVEGSHIAARLADRGCPSDRIRIHRIGIDLHKIPFEPPVPPRSDAPIRLLFCGRLIEKKGLGFAIEALALVKREGLRMELTVIGDGPLREELELRVAELDLRDEVRMVGAKTYPEFLSELGACHLLVQPSVTASDGDTEGGAPTVLIEAQAAGKPIVTTAHADIPEIVHPGQSALVVPERDVSALAAALRTLAAEPGRWRSMAEAGRRHVESEHDIGRQNEKLEAMYDELISDGRRAGKETGSAP